MWHTRGPLGGLQEHWRTGGMKYIRWTPHPVIVTIRDIKDYIRVLLFSYYTTVTGWGVLLRNTTGILGPQTRLFYYNPHVKASAGFMLGLQRSRRGLRGPSAQIMRKH